MTRNPIKLVRQSAKREKVPEVLELFELQLLLSKLFVRERTLALLDAATGLRVSELLALRWSDVDFENLKLNITRSLWHQVVGNCKTEASAKPVPMDSYMAEDLLRWRRQSDYAADDDYVFASETMKGKQPNWPDNLMKRHIRPVAKAIGINKNIDWHTFRHYAEFRTMPNVICAMVAQARRISRSTIFLFGSIRHNPACFTGS